MRRRGFQLAMVTLTVVLASASWTRPLSAQNAAAQGAAPQNADAKVLAAFKAQVDAYDALRKDLAKKTPPLKKADEPHEIGTAEKALAGQIRIARANARPGEIFTPETQRLFRRLLRPTLKGDEGAENKEVLKEDRPPETKVPFKVNGEYPKDQPLSTVPPDLLQALPRLPEGLQYRFVGKHLILYDTRANLIVDFMLNAIP